MMVRDFHRVIGDEARRQMLAREGRLPDLLIACVGGGSNAIGLFYPFLEDDGRADGRRRGGRRGRRRGPEARGAVFRRTARRAPGHEDVPARGRGRPDSADALRFRRAGLRRRRPRAQPSARPRPRRIRVRHRRRGARRVPRTRRALEGIIPALETAHAVAHAMRVAPKMGKDEIILVNLSGRGDKDVQQVAAMEDLPRSSRVVERTSTAVAGVASA